MLIFPLHPHLSVHFERKHRRFSCFYIYVLATKLEKGLGCLIIWYPFLRKKIEKLPRFDGIASSPSWHPNGKSLVLTLSKQGNKDIYSYSLANKKLTRLTQHKGIDTEASYSPDGKNLVFTSNRSGQAQIYIKNLKTGHINRATFTGRYNAKAVFSPNGKHLALLTCASIFNDNLI
jgi:TolB protein